MKQDEDFYLQNSETFSDQEDVPFSEDEFRRRRTHPRFKEHHAAEKTITKLGQTVRRSKRTIWDENRLVFFSSQNKKRLSTYVVAAGFTYGMGEGLFHYLFKGAWYNLSELLVYGKGLNYLPTIHVMDLAG